MPRSTYVLVASPGRATSSGRLSITLTGYALAWQPVSAYPLHLNQATLDFIKNGFHQSMSYYTSIKQLNANIFLRRDTGGFLRSGMCWIKKWGLAPPGVCLFPWRNYLVEIRYLRTITFATPNVKGAGS